jgi:type 1 fimbria pilin
VEIRSGIQTIPLRLRIVKVGTVTASSTFALILYLVCSSNEYSNIDQSGSKVTFNINTKAISQTCSLTNSDIQVTLPPVATKDFTGVGTTLGSTSVSLAFNCAANADAKINFTDANNESNTGTALSLQAGSTATGVGVRLSNAGNAITLANAGLFNQGATEIAVTNTGSSAAVTEVPLTARYVQTGASVTPGTVRARAIVNLAYN